MYTFAHWVSTPENRSARAAVQWLADAVCAGRLRHEPNPLVLHGPAVTRWVLPATSCSAART